LPCRSCLAQIEARRPNKWPLPSMIVTSDILLLYDKVISFQLAER
jgi:hypothetical protein